MLYILVGLVALCEVGDSVVWGVGVSGVGGGEGREGKVEGKKDDGGQSKSKDGGGCRRCIIGCQFLSR